MRTSDTDSTLLSQRGPMQLESDVEVEPTSRHLDGEFPESACGSAQRVALDVSRRQLIDEAAISSALRRMDKPRAARADPDIRYVSPMAQQLFEMCSLLQIVGIEFALDPQKIVNDRIATSVTDDIPGLQGIRTFRPPELAAARRAETGQ